MNVAEFEDKRAAHVDGMHMGSPDPDCMFCVREDAPANTIREDLIGYDYYARKRIMELEQRVSECPTLEDEFAAPVEQRVSAPEDRCPTCDSPDPQIHHATPICSDPWHEPPGGRVVTEHVSAPEDVLGDAVDRLEGILAEDYDSGSVEAVAFAREQVAPYWAALTQLMEERDALREALARRTEERNELHDRLLARDTDLRPTKPGRDV